MSSLTTVSPTKADDFSDVPANYRKGAKFTWHQFRRHRAVLGLLRGLKGNVLDYGCGYGDLSYAVSKTHEVRGTDLDPRRVAFANHEYAPIEFRVCTTTGAPYPDESFDNVLSIVVLNFIADAPTYLQEIHRLLRPGGRLLIACRNRSIVRNRIRQILRRGPETYRVHVRSSDEVSRLLTASGFCIEQQASFTDPPFVDWKNLGDVVIGSIEQIATRIGIRSAAGYFMFMAVKPTI